MNVSLSKNDPIYPFKRVVDVLRRADLVVGNLENPIIQNCPFSDNGLKFCADPRMVQGLTASNVNIVNLANNHTKNYGPDGLNQTKDYLKNAGIDFTDDDNLVIKGFNGIKFGFLGFDFVDNKPRDSDYNLIANSKKEVDVLIVMVHWGTEYSPNPTDKQKSIADNLVNAGVDIVVGTHPHMIQEIDYISGKPVFYSLGNFIFDQPWSEETKKGLVVRLTYRGVLLSKVEKLPVYMQSFAQPQFSN